MSVVKAGDTAGCLPVESAQPPLGGCGFGYGHFPAKQTGSERGRDLSKVAQLRRGGVGVGKRRETPLWKHLKVSSSPRVPGTILSLFLRHLFVQLVFPFIWQAFAEHLLGTRPDAGAGDVVTKTEVTIYGGRQTLSVQ